MNKYIIELLKLESTVIIPNFGALMKSGKSLIFNSILKYNDGKLEKFIAEQEKMDVQDVSNALSKYVREIIGILEKGDEFLIVGIGSFYKNDSGKFALKTSVNTSEKTTDTIINDDIKTESKKDNVVTSLYKDKPVKKEDKDTPTLTEQDLINSVSTKKTAKEEPKKENPKKETEKVTPTAVPPIKKEENTTPKEEKKEEKIEKPKEVVATAKPITKKEKVKEPKTKKEKKKRKVLVWLILLLLILAGGGTYVGLNLEKVKTFIGLNKPTENSNNLKENNTDISSVENETDPEEELMITDTTENMEDTTFYEEDIVNTEDALVEESPEEEVIVKEEIPTEVNKELIYHVIVGAFGDENNAIGLVEKLKKDVFSTAKLAGKYGKLTKVAASSHATKEEAEKAIEKAKSVNEDAFVEKIKL